MMTDCIGIETKHLGYLEEYAEKDKDLALRYQSVARDIHRIFGATETKAMVEVYDDEPWFHFSEDEWRTIGDLSLEKCGIPHLRIWAKNPERPITRDYYRNGNVFPNPERWQPAASVPITGDSEFREFHLNYTDKSGSRRIALLRNCLCCGGIFPCSRRDHLFCGPSEDEKQKFREIGWAAGNLDGVAEVLGKPDFHLEPVIYGKKKLNAEKGIRNMTVYANISDDVVVIFKEYNQGMIIANYAGKWRGGKVGDR